MDLEFYGDTGEQWIAESYWISFPARWYKPDVYPNSLYSFISEHMVLYQCALELAWELQQYLSIQGTEILHTDSPTQQLILCLLQY